MRLTPEELPRVQAALAALGVDGWLLYDFRGCNPIAAALIGVEGLASRRLLAWIPREGTPVGVQHAIEPGPWRHWPTAWPRRVYAGWRELEAAVRDLVGGRTVAMETSSGGGVPAMDRIPAGALEMIRAQGATVVTSGELVSQFFAAWSPAGRAAHRRAAEALARIAQEAFARAGAAAAAGAAVDEYELAEWIRARFAAAGLVADHGPIVAVDAHAADPHYEPTAATARPIVPGSVLLIDLFATEPGGVYADQTWMGSLGPPSAAVRAAWDAVRDARDAALRAIADGLAAGRPVRGSDADRAASAVLVARGYGACVLHRTGHSIDAQALHGAGPNLDDRETREDRALVEGVGFSVEPGVYLPGAFGVRSEVNGCVWDGALEVTPAAVQRAWIVV